MEATIEKIGFQTYPAYKDSGVEWLGEIPENWSILRLGAFGTFAKGGGFSKANLSDDGTRAVLYGDIYTKYNIKVEEAVRFIPDEIAAKSISIQAGDLLFTGSGETKEEIGKCVVFLGSNKTVAGGDVIIFRSKLHSKTFLSYALNTEGIKFENAKNSKGEIVVHTYASKLKELRIPIPPLPEQKAIAEFLDKKTALIDKAILIKEKQIALLQERRQILIQLAVTRGLDPNVKLKDSGVDWIGMIPEHWEVKRLKFLANCFPSNVDKHSKANESEVRLCNYTDVYKNEFITDSMKFMIATANNDQIQKFSLQKGDVIITKDSETSSDIAIPALVTEDLSNVVCGYHLAVIRPRKKSYSRYLFRAFQCKVFNIQFEVCSNGITRVGLGNSDLKKGFFLVPNEKEQIAIAEFIDSSTNKLDRIISLKDKEIEKLKEYKSTLIKSAVTGKIKVAGV